MNRRGLIQTDPARKLLRVPLRGALKALRGSADLSSFAPKVLNQGQSETCWAHSAVTLDYTRRKAKGLEAALQSPLYFAQCLYATYRAEQTASGSPLPLLQDAGAQLDDACRCFGQWGSVLFGKPEQDNNTDVPATDANGFGIPELEADTVETGALTPFGGPYDIAPGSTAPTTVADCLDAGIPVWIGTSVGQAFQELAAGQIGQPADPSDPTAGGHAMAILGYRTGPGKLQFLVRNSWGPGWCEGGNCWVSAAFIATAWSLLPFEVT